MDRYKYESHLQSVLPEDRRFIPQIAEKTEYWLSHIASLEHGDESHKAKNIAESRLVRTTRGDGPEIYAESPIIGERSQRFFTIGNFDNIGRPFNTSSISALAADLLAYYNSVDWAVPLDIREPSSSITATTADRERGSFMKYSIPSDYVKMLGDLMGKLGAPITSYDELVHTCYSLGISEILQYIRDNDVAKLKEAVKRLSTQFDQSMHIKAEMRRDKVGKRETCGLHPGVRMPAIFDITTKRDHLYYCNECHKAVFCDHELADDLGPFVGETQDLITYCRFCDKALFEETVEQNSNSYEALMEFRKAEENIDPEKSRKLTVIYGTISAIVGMIRSTKTLATTKVVKNLNDVLSRRILVMAEDHSANLRVVAACYTATYIMKMVLKTPEFTIDGMGAKTESEYGAFFIRSISAHQKVKESVVMDWLRKAYAEYKGNYADVFEFANVNWDAIDIASSRYYLAIYKLHVAHMTSPMNPVEMLQPITGRAIKDIKLNNCLEKLAPPPKMSARAQAIYDELFTKKMVGSPSNYKLFRERGFTQLPRILRPIAKVYRIEAVYGKLGKIRWEIAEKMQDIASTHFTNGVTKFYERDIVITPSEPIKAGKQREAVFGLPKKYSVTKPAQTKVIEQKQLTNEDKQVDVTPIKKIWAQANTFIFAALGRFVNQKRDEVLSGLATPNPITQSAMVVLQSYIWMISRRYNLAQNAKKAVWPEIHPVCGATYVSRLTEVVRLLTAVAKADNKLAETLIEEITINEKNNMKAEVIATISDNMYVEEFEANDEIDEM